MKPNNSRIFSMKTITISTVNFMNAISRFCANNDGNLITNFIILMKLLLLNQISLIGINLSRL